MQFKKILVAINGTDVDKDIVQLACNLARPSKGKIYVTYVIRMERTLPLDAEVKPEIDKGEESLDAAERHAEDIDYEVDTDLLQARTVGPALVNEAMERGIDLLMIGLNYKTQFGEFSLGEVIPYVLKHSPCRVMVLREPAQTKAEAKR
ncbi:MAG: universal stress protein [Dehalococcoidia bacterium]